MDKFSSCLSHSKMDGYYPGISEFQESICQLPENSYDGHTRDLNHVSERKVQNIENSETFCLFQRPYSNDLNLQKVDSFSYLTQSPEYSFSPQCQEKVNCEVKDLPQEDSQYTKTSGINLSLERKEIHCCPCLLPDDDDPLCCFKSSVLGKNTCPHILHAPYCSYELFPKSENVFLNIFKLGTNTVDQSSNSHKRLPCFLNITDKAEVDSPISFKAISPVQWTEPDYIQAEDDWHLIDFPIVAAMGGAPMCFSDFNEINKIHIKSKNSFEILEKSVTSTVDHQVDSPMFSKAGSPKHFTALDVNIAKNIENMVDFLTKTTKSGCSLPSTHPNINQTKNLQRLISLPTMTSRADSSVNLIKQDVDRSENSRQYAPIRSLLYKTELCRNFLEGNCKIGVGCQFAHGQDDLRPLDRHPMYKTKVCITFLKLGYCSFGNGCFFIHIPKKGSSQAHNLGSDGETSPHSSYSGSPPNTKSFDFDAFMERF